MRDPKRIALILEALKEFWERNPETRLGQIVGEVSTKDGVDIQWLEDSLVLEHLNAKNIEQRGKVNVLGQKL